MGKNMSYDLISSGYAQGLSVGNDQTRFHQRPTRFGAGVDYSSRGIAPPNSGAVSCHFRPTRRESWF